MIPIPPVAHLKEVILKKPNHRHKHQKNTQEKNINPSDKVGLMEDIHDKYGTRKNTEGKL
jgi:hypothetical protein